MTFYGIMLLFASVHRGLRRGIMDTVFISKKQAAENKKWRIVDAAGVPLGRLASEVAVLIRGKNKVDYTPNQDIGDFVIVINAEKVALTGNKISQKVYHRHTGYIGGLRTTSVEEMLDKYPERVIQKAVYGMLPRGPLGNTMRTRLKVYAGSEHPHKAQLPELYTLQSQAQGQAK